MEAKPLFNMQKALVQPFQMCMLDIPLSVQEDDVSTTLVLGGGGGGEPVMVRGGGGGGQLCRDQREIKSQDHPPVLAILGGFWGQLRLAEDVSGCVCVSGHTSNRADAGAPPVCGSCAD